MSEFDLVPNDGGDLQPYQPDTPLSPSNDGWLIPAPDFITDHQSYSSGGGVEIFGADLPPGTTMQQARQGLVEVGKVFSKDMASFGFDSWMAEAAVEWLLANAFLPPAPTEVRHNYNLHGFKIPPQDRDATVSFLNHMFRAGAPLKFVQAALWWISQPQQGQQRQSQNRGQVHSTDQMSDAQWAKFVAKNEQDVVNGQNALRQHWGAAFKLNMSIVSEFFRSLPVNDRERLNTTILENGVLAMSDPTTILFLYDQAIGGQLPSGAALAKEISDIENYMRTNRKAYIQNERLQARYRELVSRRDGG